MSQALANPYTPAFSYLILTLTCRVSTISIPILQVRRLRLIKGTLIEEETEPKFKPRWAWP